MVRQILKITQWILISTPIIWIAWDIVAEILGGNPDTESANVDVWAYYYPSLPLFWGILSGHFYAQNRLPSAVALPGAVFWMDRWETWVVLGLSVAWFVWDKIRYPSPMTKLIQTLPGPGHGSLIMLELGILLGYLFFQMDDATLLG